MTEIFPLQYPIYFIAVTLFMFFYGFAIVFWLLRKLKASSDLDRFLSFLLLVLIISMSTDYFTKALISLEGFGLILVILIYLATYDRYNRELRTAP